MRSCRHLSFFMLRFNAFFSAAEFCFFSFFVEEFEFIFHISFYSRSAKLQFDFIRGFQWKTFCNS